MWRFPLAVTGLLSMAALVAGALGDLPTWRRDLLETLSRVTSMLPADAEKIFRATPASSPPAIGPSQAQEDDQAARRLRELRERIAPDTATLVDLREETDKARRELSALREQRLREQAALDQMKQQAGGGGQDVGHPYNRTPPPDAVPSTTGMPTSNSGVTAPGSTPSGSRASPAGTSPSGAPQGPAIGSHGSEADPKPGPRSEEKLKSPIAKHLLAARTALAARQNAQARRLLNLAKREMKHPPATHEAQTAGGEPMRDVEFAISMLDRGDADAALRAVDQALTVSDDATQRPGGDRPGDNRSGESLLGAH